MPNIHHTLRKFREQKQWTQEELADKLGISKNGYAKIERGESRPSLDRLEQITQVLGIKMAELFHEYKKSIYLISENSSNYYSSSQALIAENEKLQVLLTHKDDIIKQKDEQIALLKALVATLQKP